LSDAGERAEQELSPLLSPVQAQALSPAQALLLGLAHGPGELLPISSSAHTTLVPWLLGWRYAELEPRLRKSFEVALHLGTAIALVSRPPWHSDGALRRGSSSSEESGAWPRPIVLAGALAPPALVGFALGERIERQLGTPGTIAAGLVAGTVAMALPELCSSGRRAACGRQDARGPGKVGRGRRAEQAEARDGLALGTAQALALVPGLSRSGLAGAAARSRGFGRLQADRLGWQVGLPVIGGAALLQSARLLRRGVRREERAALAVGAIGALLSTRACVRLLDARTRTRLLPATIVYRAALAALVIRRMRDNTEGSIQTTA
jgi:undecaprenyl-diphosphatase